jgi:uncharacterized integral membrane protein
MKTKQNVLPLALIMLLSCLLNSLLIITADAHHILGRPAYSLNEDSNTPPSMNLETQIGDYFVTAMVYPAFPKPNEAGRIHLYANHLDKNEPLNTDVTFTVRDDSWFGSETEQLGAQVLEDSVYRQGFVFRQEGDYIITAQFEADGEPYTIDFPLRVGNPLPIGLLGSLVGFVLLLLISVSIFQRKKLKQSKRRLARETNKVKI